ncbi:hypothetical protein TH63_03705 [Rufibacter radiotolerans]|uniref:Uncharacterized protein n=1 Tax=Rufibacter radiotolerans TaxID=1379910 RepID=A0A0H4W3B0_9BACT|nr:hypothetical protein [Rufibacter radiotolerans]AKQ44931.1 hypothetical protein TH63_03705 [Rufibacter radiotolerans]
MKKLTFFFFAIILLFVAGFTIKERRKSNEDREKLKRVAFCSCLYKSNPKSDFWENEGSAAGYFETGNFGIDAMETIDSMALEISKKKYSSKLDKRLDIMKCMDFYNSKELEDKVKMLVK